MEDTHQQNIQFTSKPRINITKSLSCAAMYYFFVVTLIHLSMTTWVLYANYEAQLGRRYPFSVSSELQFGFYALYTKDKQWDVAKRLLVLQP